jgi:hypothetical protein
MIHSQVFFVRTIDPHRFLPATERERQSSAGREQDGGLQPEEGESEGVKMGEDGNHGITL